MHTLKRSTFYILSNGSCTNSLLVKNIKKIERHRYSEQHTPNIDVYLNVFTYLGSERGNITKNYRNNS